MRVRIPALRVFEGSRTSEVSAPGFARCDSWRVLSSARGGAQTLALLEGCAFAVHTLRFYITPHFGKCPPVTALKLRFVSPTASRPIGFPKKALCKVAS
jgi:hypothetical protein